MKRILAAKQRLAVSQARKVQKALIGSVDVQKLAADWFRQHENLDDMEPRQARIWVQQNTVVKSDIGKVLPSVYAAGYVFGRRSAQYLYAVATGMKKAGNSLTAVLNTDWATWTPGNEAAAALVNPQGALAALLGQSGITGIRTNDIAAIERYIDQTTMDRLGTILADALNRGLNMQQTANGLRQVVSDPQRALTIARTETARAVIAAQKDEYRQMEVEMVEWLVADPCDECQENLDQSPISIDDEWLNGDPPVHPNCMCDVAPYVVATIEMMVKGVPGPMEVERALSRLAILPNPIPSADNPDPDETVQSPWETVPVPTLSPQIWDSAEVEVVDLLDLLGTDPYLFRDEVTKHIKSMGQAVTPYRSFALCVKGQSGTIILDGHHRLFAWWLLGQERAPVWLAKESM